MTVYLEDAFLQNYILDAILLYAALRCARSRVLPAHLFCSSAAGAVGAILFPLLSLPAWAGYAVKLLGGALLAVFAVQRGSARHYCAVYACFLLFTLLLGGTLFALRGAFADGRAFPPWAVVAVAGILLIAGERGGRALLRYLRMRGGVFDCVLWAGDRQVRWRGLSDSGNLLTFRGEPVCVIPPAAALALFGHAAPVGRIAVNTVNGRSVCPVFRCPRMAITEGGRRIVHAGVYLAVGRVPRGEYEIILHSKLTEGMNEAVRIGKRVAPAYAGRKGHPLSVRK